MVLGRLSGSWPNLEYLWKNKPLQQKPILPRATVVAAAAALLCNVSDSRELVV